MLGIGEVAKGVALAEVRRRDMQVQRDFLDSALPERFGARILAFDGAAAIVNPFGG